MRNVILIAALAALSTGCASVTRGSNEAFSITTSPAQAKVTVDDTKSRQVCMSPCSVKVKRKPTLTVFIEKKGYKNVSTTIASSVDGAGAAGMAGNVIFGGIIGAAVDVGTGAMNSHKPNPFFVELEKVEGQAAD